MLLRNGNVSLEKVDAVDVGAGFGGAVVVHLQLLEGAVRLAIITLVKQMLSLTRSPCVLLRVLTWSGLLLELVATVLAGYGLGVYLLGQVVA